MHLVDLFGCMMVHGLTNPKFLIIFALFFYLMRFIIVSSLRVFIDGFYLTYFNISVLSV
jgi:hypothetical protein